MGKKPFYNPTQHPDWIPPHSQEWYDRLASEHGDRTWRDSDSEPNAVCERSRTNLHRSHFVRCR
jgi:hypothetical protein